MEGAKLNQLKLFIDQCKSNPSLLSDPSLSFFRDYLECVGANLPASAYKSGESRSKSRVVDESEDDVEYKDDVAKPAEDEGYERVEIVESDVEFGGDVVEPDTDPSQKMGDSCVEVTEENRDASQDAKGQAMEAISEGKLEEAIKHLTEPIMPNPTSAIMYATRDINPKVLFPSTSSRDTKLRASI